MKVDNFFAEMTQKTESNIRNLEKLETKVKEVSENNFILVHAVDDIERASKSLKRQFENLENTF